VQHGKSRVVLSGNAPETTNNQMELEAAVAALAYLGGRYEVCQIELHTDSRYLRQGITSWIDSWFARGWRSKSGQPIKNQELWRRLYDLSQAHEIRWIWVKGHAGDPMNELVDRLATEARVSLTQGTPEGGGAEPESDKEGETVLWIAVSCRGSSGPGGWAVVFCEGKRRQVLEGFEAQTTGNALYLSAAIAGLEAIRSPGDVVVRAASDYLIQGAAQWVQGWQQRGWQTKDGKAVKNQAQWKELLGAMQRHRVRWQAVKEEPSSPELAEARRLAAEQLASVIS
jgi:ribonuclease HI